MFLITSATSAAATTTTAAVTIEISILFPVTDESLLVLLL